MATTPLIQRAKQPKAVMQPKPGAIQQQTSALTTSSQYKPTTQAFDESKGVEGRVTGLVNKNNPLMQIAQTRAAQGANARGLRNSSMAVQAGQQAVIETATPIANADANLYQQQNLTNQAAQNDAAKTNAGMRMNIGLEGMRLGENSRQFDTTAGLERGRLDENARQFDAGLGLEGKKLEQQGSQFDKNLTEQRRQFDFSGNLDLKKLEQDNNQFMSGLTLEKNKLTAQKDQFAKQFGLDERNLNQQQKQFLADLKLKEKTLDQQAKQATAQLNMQKTIAQMDADNRLNLAKVEAGYKNEIAGNENISNAWGTMMNSINDIQNNPDIDASAKKTMIQNSINSFGKFTEFWKKVTGGKADISDLLKFGVIDPAGEDKDGDGKPDKPAPKPKPKPGDNPNDWMPDSDDGKA